MTTRRPRLRSDRALFAILALALANAVADLALFLSSRHFRPIRPLGCRDGRLALAATIVTPQLDPIGLAAADRVSEPAVRERRPASGLTSRAGRRNGARDARPGPSALRAQLRDPLDGRARRRRGRVGGCGHWAVDRCRRRGLADRPGHLRDRDRPSDTESLSRASPHSPCRSRSSSRGRGSRSIVLRRRSFDMRSRPRAASMLWPARCSSPLCSAPWQACPVSSRRSFSPQRPVGRRIGA